MTARPSPVLAWILQIALVLSCAAAIAAGANPVAAATPSVIAFAVLVKRNALGSAVALRPRLTVAAFLAAFAAWNLALMDQYRRNLLPADDTIDFVRVIENLRAAPRP